MPRELSGHELYSLGEQFADKLQDVPLEQVEAVFAVARNLLAQLRIAEARADAA